MTPRQLWQRFETVHAVTYFAPECREAHKDAGLAGFWMGYFAGRAAPLGAVGPAVVGSLFFNFHDAMVRRALPDAWQRATPDAVMAERVAAAASALRRLVPDAGARAARLVPVLRRGVEAAPPAGRPLFAANRDLAYADPVAMLWQTCTALREHRGDGHVAALTTAGLDGCEVHVLFVASTGAPADLHRDSRGWSTEEWGAAAERLCRRGLIGDDGGITATGAALRRDIESTTDRLAERPWVDLGATEIDASARDLDAIARTVQAAGLIPFPNPMGLPPVPATGPGGSAAQPA